MKHEQMFVDLVVKVRELYRDDSNLALVQDEQHFRERGLEILARAFEIELDRRQAERERVAEKCGFFNLRSWWPAADALPTEKETTT